MRAVYASLILICRAPHTTRAPDDFGQRLVYDTLGTFPPETSRFNQRQPHRHEESAWAWWKSLHRGGLLARLVAENPQFRKLKRVDQRQMVVFPPRVDKLEVHRHQQKQALHIPLSL